MSHDVNRRRGDFQSRSAELVNLTGHWITVYEHGTVVRSVPAAHRGLRIEHVQLGEDRIDDAGVDVVAVAIKPSVLPEQREGVWLVVTQVAALSLALAGVRRPDIVFPGPAVTKVGKVVGCRGLRQIVVAG